MALYAGLLCSVVATGCATLSAPQLRTERQVLSSTELTIRRPGELTVRDAQWHGSTLSATLEQQEFCQRTAMEQVSYQSIANRKASGLPATIALSVAGAAAGGMVLAWSTRLPNNPSASVISEQGAAQLGGAVLLTWALTGIVDAIKVGHDSGDTPEGQPRIADESRPIGASTPCGMVPPSGELIFAFGEHEALRLPVDRTGQVRVDVEAERARLCGRDADIGTPLRISWKVGEATREVASASADDCIRAQVASLLLAHAREIVESANGPERLVAADPALRTAGRLVAALSAQHPRHQELEEQLSVAHHERAARAEQLLTGLLARVPQALAEGGPFALSPDLDALELATGTPLQGSATISVLQSFARAATADLPTATTELEDLLDRRRELKVCLERSDACPDGTTQAAELDALKPIAAQLIERSMVERHSAEELAHSLPASPDEQTSRSLTKAVANLKALSLACHVVTWDSAAAAECAQLLSSIHACQAALQSAHEQGYAAVPGSE